MNSFTNATIQTIATGLVALGAATIQTDLVAGVVEILLGLAAYVVYEKLPPTK